MKKAKIILFAIAVLGALGSTLAFKVAKRVVTGHLIYVTTVNNAAACITLARAVTVAIAAQGSYWWYTNRKCQPGVFFSKFTIDL